MNVNFETPQKISKEFQIYNSESFRKFHFSWTQPLNSKNWILDDLDTTDDEKNKNFNFVFPWIEDLIQNLWKNLELFISYSIVA